MIFILSKMEIFIYTHYILYNVGCRDSYTIYCVLYLSGEVMMECPYCHKEDTKVTDSRDTGSISIRRRRECLSCGKRFTTYEYIELSPIYVIKKDGRREKFERGKIKKGIVKALEKRPISHEKIEELLDEIEEILDDIEERIRQNGSEDIESKKIGEYVMDSLKKTDHVAYIRFASVYRRFADISSFEEEIKNLTKQNVVGGINKK